MMRDYFTGIALGIVAFGLLTIAATGIWCVIHINDAPALTDKEDGK